MRKNFVIIISLIVAFFFVQSSRAAERLLPCKKFVYKQTQGKDQTIEVYFPPNHDPSKDKVPGVILFHGGGWYNGGLEQFRYACSYLASRGMVAATANYFIIPKKDSGDIPVPETKKRCITDAKSAIRWMKQHASEFGMDPNKLITGGGSAGGHISVLATSNPGLNDPADPKDIDTSVVAYLLFNPAFGGKGDTEDPDVDAIKHVKADFPPAIVFFGTKDGWWKSGWAPLEKKLKELGVKSPIKVWLAEGQTHGYWDNPDWNDLNLIEADKFLVSIGLLKGETTLKPASDKKLVPAEQ